MADHAHSMRVALGRVCLFETLKDYDRRNAALIEALHYATASGLPCGVRFDSNEPEWPVVFFELSTGQVSWHIEQHRKEWDGHSTEEKYRRLHQYLREWF